MYIPRAPTHPPTLIIIPSSCLEPTHLFFSPQHADSSSDDSAPVTVVDYNLDTGKLGAQGRAGGGAAARAVGGFGGSLASSSSASASGSGGAGATAGPVALDHLSSRDLAAAINTGALAGKAFSLDSAISQVS